MSGMKWISFLFRKISALCYRAYQLFDGISRKLFSPPLSVCEANKIIWYKIKGDETLRLNYDLDADSVVYDIGGYEGDWAAEISARYGCKLYVFEPVSVFVDNLRQRLGKNKTIQIFPYGLAGKEEHILIAHLDEGSSVFRDENNLRQKAEDKEMIRLRPIDKVMNELGTSTIDLMKMNIEGGEYELLECLLMNGLVKNIGNLQIQFHDFVPDAETRMKNIKARLSETHELTYEYLYVWENWKLRK
jgi:FkbM family methyltransferase